MVVKVLLMAKDMATSDLLAPSLERKGYQVALARDRSQALSCRRSFRPDVLVIDVASFGLAGCNLDAIRSRLGGVPAILLAEDGHSLGVGRATAVITPPFTARKLLHRLEKVAETLPCREFQAGDLVLDPVSWTLHKGQCQIRLRPKEAALLALFLRNPGRVLSRKEIMKQVWDTDHLDDTRTLNVHIRWLRLKIEDNPSRPRLLRTVRGVGYQFQAVYFFPEGERWRDHGVVGVGEQQVCPPQTTTYRLRVIKADDSAEVHQITVQVRG
jgi:DNA-binding response OmpR family regulator